MKGNDRDHWDFARVYLQDPRKGVNSRENRKSRGTRHGRVLTRSARLALQGCGTHSRFIVCRPAGRVLRVYTVLYKTQEI